MKWSSSGGKKKEKKVWKVINKEKEKNVINQEIICDEC